MVVKINQQKKAELERKKLKTELAQSDSDMARLGEDLYAALVDTGVLKESDIPKSARDKMDARKALRDKLGEKRK